MVNYLYKKCRIEHEFVIRLKIFLKYFQKKEGFLNIDVVYVFNKKE